MKRILMLLLLGICAYVTAMNVKQTDQANLDSQLAIAATEGTIQQVEQLIARGADVNAKNNDGWTPLMWAANRGSKEICELLISKGADVNAQNIVDDTALMLAAIDGYKEVCELLITKGADVNAQNSDGDTALMRAALRGDKEICELLIPEMIKPTPEQIDTVVALLGTKKFRKTKHLNLIGRDVVRIIGQEKYKAFEQENKSEVRKEIMKIQNATLRKELLDYLASL